MEIRPPPSPSVMRHTPRLNNQHGHSSGTGRTAGLIISVRMPPHLSTGSRVQINLSSGGASSGVGPFRRSHPGCHTCQFATHNSVYLLSILLFARVLSVFILLVALGRVGGASGAAKKMVRGEMSLGRLIRSQGVLI